MRGHTPQDVDRLDPIDVYTENEDAIGELCGLFDDIESIDLTVRHRSPWVEITIHRELKGFRRYAIWRETSAVHAIEGPGDEYPGAVKDDAIDPLTADNAWPG